MRLLILTATREAGRQELGGPKAADRELIAAGLPLRSCLFPSPKLGMRWRARVLLRYLRYLSRRA